MKARGEIEESLDTRAEVETPQSFPNGCHVAEVEIDPETGHVRIVNYVAVDDCGTVLNHTLVEGQVLGGLAQGIGQALLEEVVYAPDSGQLVTGTFNDYAMPRADTMPPVASGGASGSLPDQSARREGRGRGRHDRRARRDHERHSRCDPRRPRRRPADAGDAGEGVASVPGTF